MRSSALCSAAPCCVALPAVRGLRLGRRCLSLLLCACPHRSSAMPKYSKEPDNAAKSCKASGSDLRVHFKNTAVTAAAIRAMTLKKAKGYLENVLKKTEAIPFRFYNGCIGRHAQAKNVPGAAATQCRWPTKSCKFLLHLLKNAESNAEVRPHFVPTPMACEAPGVRRAAQFAVAACHTHVHPSGCRSRALTPRASRFRTSRSTARRSSAAARTVPTVAPTRTCRHRATFR